MQQNIKADTTEFKMFYSLLLLGQFEVTVSNVRFCRINPMIMLALFEEAVYSSAEDHSVCVFVEYVCTTT